MENQKLSFAEYKMEVINQIAPATKGQQIEDTVEEMKLDFGDEQIKEDKEEFPSSDIKIKKKDKNKNLTIIEELRQLVLILEDLHNQQNIRFQKVDDRLNIIETRLQIPTLNIKNNEISQKEIFNKQENIFKLIHQNLTLISANQQKSKMPIDNMRASMDYFQPRTNVFNKPLTRQSMFTHNPSNVFKLNIEDLQLPPKPVRRKGRRRIFDGMDRKYSCQQMDFKRPFFLKRPIIKEEQQPEKLSQLSKQSSKEMSESIDTQQIVEMSELENQDGGMDRDIINSNSKEEEEKENDQEEEEVKQEEDIIEQEMEEKSVEIKSEEEKEEVIEKNRDKEDQQEKNERLKILEMYNRFQHEKKQGDIVFLIDLTWWEEFTEQEVNRENDEFEQIQNECLLESGDKIWEHLEENIDFVSTSPYIFHALEQTYGCDFAIKRVLQDIDGELKVTDIPPGNISSVEENEENIEVSSEGKNSFEVINEEYKDSNEDIKDESLVNNGKGKEVQPVENIDNSENSTLFSDDSPQEALETEKEIEIEEDPIHSLTEEENSENIDPDERIFQ